MRAPAFGAKTLARILGGALLFVAPAAYAGDEVAAEALFDEAKKLATAGNYAKACPMFAESNRLDRGAGTLIHLADCYEKNKQSASAWATYKEAASAAQALNRKDWEKLAATRAAALEPKLARLTLKVDPANERAELTRDGTPVSKATWNIALPVDVGQHTVEAKAPGQKTFTSAIVVTKDGERVELVVPKLEPEPAAAPAPVPGPIDVTTPPEPLDADHGTGGSTQRTIGFVVGGIGVAGLALGAVTGLMAIGKASDAKDVCPNDGRCTAPNARGAADDADSARTLGLVSTIGFIAGGVGVAAGAALVFTAPSPKKTGVRVLPNLGGLSVVGSF